MQVLKGNIFKSVTVQNLLITTKSYCVVYLDTRLPFECYLIDSQIFSLNELKSYLQNYNDNMNYEYFILYTHNTEEELKDIIEYIKKNEYKFNCKCFLITCRNEDDF
jgi:hypothetical protein